MFGKLKELNCWMFCESERATVRLLVLSAWWPHWVYGSIGKPIRVWVRVVLSMIVERLPTKIVRNWMWKQRYVILLLLFLFFFCCSVLLSAALTETRWNGLTGLRMSLHVSALCRCCCTHTHTHTTRLVHDGCGCVLVCASMWTVRSNDMGLMTIVIRMRWAYTNIWWRRKRYRKAYRCWHVACTARIFFVLLLPLSLSLTLRFCRSCTGGESVWMAWTCSVKQKSDKSVWRRNQWGDNEYVLK